MANQLPKDVGENVERNYETHLASLGLDLSGSDDDLICYETMTESDEEEDALCNEAMDNNHVSFNRAAGQCHFSVVIWVIT